MLSVFLTACATRPPLPLETAPRAFVIERDLLGATTARGEFRAINGGRRGFTAYLNGTWDGSTFTLVEDFEFDDGERDRKTWRLTRTASGEYIGSREDVVGEARGFQDGNAFRLEYDMRLPARDGKGMKVRFRDVMVFNESGEVLNNATVGYFGLRVASVSLVIRRAPQAAAQGEIRQSELAF
jgi:hypothetical protein